MTIFGLIAGVTLMQRAVAMGQKDAGIAFSIVPWSGILFFAVVFAIGIAMVRRPEVHKRLMLLCRHLDPRCGGGALVSHFAETNQEIIARRIA